MLKLGNLRCRKRASLETSKIHHRIKRSQQGDDALRSCLAQENSCLDKMSVEW